MSTTTDLPSGVSDTFTFTCPCEATVHVTGGVEQAHDCPLTEEQKQALRDLAAAELEAEREGGDQVDEQPVVAIACANAICFSTGGLSRPARKLFALTHSIDASCNGSTPGGCASAIELAQATRAAYQLNLQMAQLAVNERNAAAARAAGPSGIVVPSMVPGR